MFYLEESCPVCEDGILGFLKCSDGKTIVVMCEECCSVWLKPDEIGCEEPIYPQAPDFRLPNTDISVKGGGSEWAAYEEIIDIGFGVYVSKEREYTVP